MNEINTRIDNQATWTQEDKEIAHDIVDGITGTGKIVAAAGNCLGGMVQTLAAVAVARTDMKSFWKYLAVSGLAANAAASFKNAASLFAEPKATVTIDEIADDETEQIDENTDPTDDETEDPDDLIEPEDRIEEEK